MTSDTHRNALKPGYRVHWYRIERILGQGGFGITYLADDTNLNQKVALKEYLPVEVAVRESDYSVHPVSRNHDESFSWGLDRFLDEARTLARFDHSNIVRVLSVFEMNNTAYMVMRYESGKSLQQMLPKRACIEEERLTTIVFPIMDGLEQVHNAGFIHRDIKPANIFIREDGSPVLLDFGSARQSLGEATRTLTTLVSPGYAPFEQYYSKSDKQGPWTDIYGLGATMYRAVVGVPPMNAVDRSERILKQGQDALIPAEMAAANRYSPALLGAIDWSLRFDEAQRPQSIARWRQSFEAGEVPAAAAAPTPSGDDAPTVVREENDPPTATIDRPQESASAATETNPPTTVSAPYSRRSMAVIALLAVFALLSGVLATLALSGRTPGTMETDAGAIPPTPPASSILPDSPASPETEPAQLPASQPAADPIQDIEPLLRAAKTDIEALRLSRPSGNNALEKYRRVLAIDPNNQDAKKGMRKIVEAYAELGKHAVRQKNYDRAELYLNEALSISPDSEKLHKARQKLEQLRRGAD